MEFFKKNKDTIFCIIIILVGISLAYYQFITVAKNFNFTELLYFWSFGNASAKHNFLSYHQIGLWDNYNGLGYPLIAHLSSQFYPLTFAFLFIPDFLYSLKLEVFSHFLLAGLSCFYLLRVLKCNKFAAILAP